MPTFRYRTPEVEAIQYRPGPAGNCHEVGEFVGLPIEPHDDCSPDESFDIGNLQQVEPGDYVVRWRGELRVLSAEDFEAEYEAVLP